MGDGGSEGGREEGRKRKGGRVGSYCTCGLYDYCSQKQDIVHVIIQLTAGKSLAIVSMALVVFREQGPKLQKARDRERGTQLGLHNYGLHVIRMWFSLDAVSDLDVVTAWLG